MIKSLNKMLVCKPYKGARGLRSKVSSGVAVVQQRTEVVGLEVLEDAFVDQNYTIKKGSIVYFKEELLYNHKDIYCVELNCSEIKEPFILAHFGHVAFVKEKK